MPNVPEDTDLNNWHRYFAMESNNRAWQLAVQTRTSVQDFEMLNAAHAAALHWEVVGTEVHHMRAKMLLAEVHSLLGFGPSALDYADEVLNYFIDRDTPDWEIAYVHTIHAHSALVAGETERHQASYYSAKQAIDAITDTEDRNIVLKTFDQVSAP